MKIKTYDQTREYLETFIKPIIFERITPEQAKIQDPLSRMRHFLSILGNPQNKFSSILVGGTAGKGSTAYLISHILKTQGYKTGLTISPHLVKINERMQINGASISDKELVQLVNLIVQTIELMKKSKFGEPSYFEILIALAFLYFAKEKVDIAVVEVGMGGHYDATNTLNPLISVLTNVSLDHTNILGKTVEKIAREKVGIIKERRKTQNRTQKDAENSVSVVQRFVQRSSAVAVVTGAKQKSVIKIVEDRCKEVGVEIFRLGKDFGFQVTKEDIGGSVFDFQNKTRKISNLKLSLQGEYQVENAALALETVLKLQKFGLKIEEKNIRNALKKALFPGRFEVIYVARGPVAGFPPASARSSLNLPSQGSNELRAVGSLSTRATPRKNYTLYANPYTLILDGAHNPTKMKAFVQTLKKLYASQRKIFIVGFKKDKDVSSMLKKILPIADAVIATEFKMTTDASKNASMEINSIKYSCEAGSRSARQISKIKNKKSKVKIYTEKDSKKALEKALKLASSRDDLIIVTGSLYLVGEIRAVI